ncbi:hypothetical protein RvY_12901 [Ramazzottius varieornatus]|uniref:Uncharacterized protein n=1 Tax=Ramazzottius varieornatus TaxID=947166 RepID=A0A1D1VNB2_RAMVA|nr:hypothetical protein RvY_12901 [Ramazzottius varieornatus]
MDDGKEVIDRCHMYEVDYFDEGLVRKGPSTEDKVVPYRMPIRPTLPEA